MVVFHGPRRLYPRLRLALHRNRRSRLIDRANFHHEALPGLCPRRFHLAHPRDDGSLQALQGQYLGTKLRRVEAAQVLQALSDLSLCVRRLERGEVLE